MTVAEITKKLFGKTDGYNVLLAIEEAGAHVEYFRGIRNPIGIKIGPTADASQLKKLLEILNYVGVMTVEFFVKNSSLQVNEIAPRVHNSGHWTINAAVTSQFENHLRAICGMPLGDTSMTQPSLMFNWIGNLPDKQLLMSVPGVCWHEYGKSARPGRKLGHCTVIAENRDELLRRCSVIADDLASGWPGLLTLLE